MKKIILIGCSILLLLPIACKKQEDQKKKSEVLDKKYAMYRVSVYKDKDFGKWLATLGKAESVDLLEEEQYINQKKRQVDLSKVRLSDGKEGYIESRHLAQKPIVFIEDDVKVFIRPDVGSGIIAKISKGTIGFIKEEKADWIQVYIGNIAGKWITKHWVNSGYSTDPDLVLEAKEYESIMTVWDREPGDMKEKAYKEAVDKLKSLAKGTSVIAEMAKVKLDELEGKSQEEVKETAGPEKIEGTEDKGVNVESPTGPPKDSAK